MMQAAELMLLLLRASLFDYTLSEKDRALINGENIKAAYALAKRHDLAHLLWNGLVKSSAQGLIDGEIASKIKQEFMLSAYRYGQMNYELEKLCAIFERGGIDFIPLKGAVMRALYPEGWMRTSCDIDILIKEDELERAERILTEANNYKTEVKSSHDLAFYSPSGVYFELHYDLLEDYYLPIQAQIARSVWDRVKLKEGYSHFYMMDDDIFYFYHISHMVKHFENGGCGIRPFIDLCFMKTGGENWGKRRAILELGQLSLFEKAAQRLSSVWFFGKETDALSQKLGDYIIHGGVYGTSDNRIAIGQNQNGGKTRYLLSKIFLPYDIIKYHYPILQKHKYLTPFMQVRRWFKLIFCGHMKRVKREIEINRTLKPEKSGAARELMSELGLYFNEK